MKTHPLIKILLVCALCAPSGTAAPAGETHEPAPAPALRIATVDMQELFKEYHKTREAQKQINVNRARVQKEDNERLARIRELQDIMEQLRKQLDDPTVNESKKNTVFKDFQIRQQEGVALERDRREFHQRKTAALNEQMVREMKSILMEIRAIVGEQAKLDNFDYVFDRSGLSSSQVPFMLYTKDSTDITADLLKLINRKDPGGDSGKKTGTGGALKPDESR